MEAQVLPNQGLLSQGLKQLKMFQASLKKIWPFRKVSYDVDALSAVRSSVSNVEVFNFKWSIDNFNENRNVNYHSPNFGPSEDHAIQFSLQFRTRAVNNHNYCSLFVDLVASDRGQLSAYYTCSILNADGKKRKTKGNSAISVFAQGEPSWGWSQFIHRTEFANENDKLLKGNQLVIFCEIMIIPPMSTMNEVPFSAKSNSFGNFQNLLEDEMFTDVVLVGRDGCEFSAHKVILASRSKAFKREFNQNRLDLTDVEAEVIKELLNYIYTGEISSLDQFAQQLLPLANKFRLDHLKELCERTLCSQLPTSQTLLDFLELAKLHEASHLKEKALECIQRKILVAIENDNNLLAQTFQELLNNGHISQICNDKVVNFSHIWTIKNFNRLCDGTISNRHPSIYSCYFGPSPNSPLKFYLEFRPRRVGNNFGKWTALYLHFYSSTEKSVSAWYQFSVLDSKGFKHYIKGDILRRRKNFISGQRGFGRTLFARRDDLLNSSKGLVKNGKLTILCEIKVVVPFDDPNMPTDEDKFDQNDLACDHSWLANVDYSDVVLEVNGKELPAQKAILVSRSPVFADMFKFDMSEKLESRINIPDVETEVFEEMLKYILTGQVSIKRFPAKLLAVADKFQMDALKTLCEQHLAAKLSFDNVIEVLQLADLYDANELKKKAFRLMKKPTLAAIEAITDQESLVDTFRDLVNGDNLDH